MLKDATDATDRYYRNFALKHGFADRQMRGTGHAIVVRPIGDVDDETCDASKYVRGADERGAGSTNRDRTIEKAARVRQRAERAEQLLADLAALVHTLRNRMETKRNSAVRDAYADAQAMIAGEEPRAKGSRTEILERLVGLLARHA